jgi:hypothetical protein
VAEDTKGPGKVNFDYIKGNLFRVIHVDGAIGSITPQAMIHAALYSERPAIPQRLVHWLNPDGSLGERIEEETATRGAVVRELEADLMMSVGVAESLANWLMTLVREHRSLAKATAAQESGRRRKRGTHASNRSD